MRLLLKSLLRMIWIVLGIIALGVVALYFLQDKIIFYPRKYVTGDRELAANYEILEYITNRDGKQRAYYRGPTQVAPEKLWVLAGGNGSLALEWEIIVKKASELNPENGFLLIEYPGYGMCAGSPSRAGIQQNVEGAIEALGEHLNRDDATLKSHSSFLGHSMGAAVVLETAADWKRGEVIALAPFTSLQDMGARMVGRPLSNLARHKWDNRAAVRTIASFPDPEILILHGDRDQVIPIEMGRELSEMKPETVTFHEISGVGHNNIVWEIRDILVTVLSN